jgi:putative SOS response-associated peptidase YedK
MCGRFTLTDDNRERVAAMLGVPPDQLVEEDYRPRWNIAPTDPHWIVRMKHEDRAVLPAKWGSCSSAPRTQSELLHRSTREPRRSTAAPRSATHGGRDASVVQRLLSPTANEYLIALPVSTRRTQ